MDIFSAHRDIHRDTLGVHMDIFSAHRDIHRDMLGVHMDIFSGHRDAFDAGHQGSRLANWMIIQR